MSRQFSPLAVFFFMLSVLAIGCRPQQPFFLQEDGDLSHYIGMATDIDYPDVNVPSLGEVTGAKPPLTLENPKPEQMWDLPLQDAMRYALENSKVIRNLGRCQLWLDRRSREPVQPADAGIAGADHLRSRPHRKRSSLRRGRGAGGVRYSVQREHALAEEHGSGKHGGMGHRLPPQPELGGSGYVPGPVVEDHGDRRHVRLGP